VHRMNHMAGWATGSPGSVFGVVSGERPVSSRSVLEGSPVDQNSVLSETL